MIERLAMDTKYSAQEASIHLNRYIMAQPYCNGKKVLDISCGEGYGSRLLKDWGAESVVGLDISEEAISKAKDNFEVDGLEYIVHDAMILDCFDDETFDMIVSFETIEHLNNPLKFLQELKRVSKKGAQLIISCPNDYLYYPNDNEHNPYHIRKYTFEEFQELIEKVFSKNNVNYTIGSKAEGFINFSPNNCDKIIFQKQMINNHFIHGGKGINIPSDTLVGVKNCSYYTAFIHITDIQDSFVVFPSTIVKWAPDLISWDAIKMLEYRTENEYMKKNMTNMVLSFRESEEFRKQVSNSRTYRFSLKLYRFLNKFRWRKQK